MKGNRDIATHKVTKYKARLNLHSGKQEQEINFFDTPEWWMSPDSIDILCEVLNNQPKLEEINM